MRTLFAAILVAASVLATPALAVMCAVNPAITQNLAARPKKVVLLPPQVFVYELSAGGVPTRMADWEATARANLSAAATSPPICKASWIGSIPNSKAACAHICSMRRTSMHSPCPTAASM